jgi:hypothetical protein
MEPIPTSARITSGTSNLKWMQTVTVPVSPRKWDQDNRSLDGGDRTPNTRNRARGTWTLTETRLFIDFLSFFLKMWLTSQENAIICLQVYAAYTCRQIIVEGLQDVRRGIAY